LEDQIHYGTALSCSARAARHRHCSEDPDTRLYSSSVAEKKASTFLAETLWTSI
jgi:hypothetical protein